mmetsp:Transcript_3241/g.7580  ORF Transcript_3241/g.7580 Transcript_3241/m.7580 type:complete len:84 (+) Transcript_3241:1156-1407(+)
MSSAVLRDWLPPSNPRICRLRLACMVDRTSFIASSSELMRRYTFNAMTEKKIKMGGPKINPKMPANELEESILLKVYFQVMCL